MKLILDLDDDPARTVMGGSWRTPTYTEWSELMRYGWVFLTDTLLQIKDNTGNITLTIPRKVSTKYTTNGEYLTSNLFNPSLNNNPYCASAFYSHYTNLEDSWGYGIISRNYYAVVRAVIDPKDI